MELRKCIICGENFFIKYYNQKTCSKKCSKDNYILIQKEWYRKNYLKNSEIIKEKSKNRKPYKQVCIECGKEFYSGYKKSKFCNNKCNGKFNKKARIGKNNPAYRNGLYSGKDRTIINHKYRLFEKIRDRLRQDMINNKGYIYCEYCGINNTARWEMHHLVYRSEKPKHKNLHNRLNLINLCINCHNDFHKHKSKRNKIVEERKLNELFGNDILNK